MSARQLLVVFDSVYVLALAAWVGSNLFLSFSLAPLIFRVLDAENAARFVRALFPRYYAWGAISGAIALPALLGVPLSFPEYRGPLVGIQALLIVAGILMMFYGGNSLTPAINAARDAGDAGAARFARLHRRSVVLNTLVLVIGIGLLVAHETRSAPTTAGILEMTPGERTQYDAEIAKVLRGIEERQSAQLRDRLSGKPGAAAPASGPERFPIDEATIRELVELYARRRRPPASAPAGR